MVIRLGARAWLGIALVLTVVSIRSALASASIALIMSERAAAYDELAAAFVERLGDTRDARLLYADELDSRMLQSLAREVRLWVPVGSRATRLVAEHAGRGAAVLALMVPRSAFEEENWSPALSRRRLSAVFIDQPPSRSLDLIERLLPQARSVGVLHSPRMQPALSALQQEAARRRVYLRLVEIGQTADLAGGLKQVLPQSDVLLLLPDAQIVNPNHLQPLLLTTYRYRVPVIGFSQGLVKAGAIAAVFSTPAQIGAQGGDIARQWRSGEGDLPPPMHSHDFSIALNPHVARSLGLNLPEEARLRQQLGAGP